MPGDFLPPVVGLLRLDNAQFLTATRESTGAMRTMAAEGKVSAGGFGQVAEKALKAISIASGVAAVGAIKLATSFDSSMTKIRGLVGASQGQVATWSNQILDLAPKVGKGPQELADALYFVASSGVDASKAMGVVKVSAEASAAGLGSTEVVADAVTSAMNAYAKEGLSAARATDVLVATVRDGKGEPAQLAQAIGRVLAPAEAMGVTFDQVGASVAAMSLVMPDVNEDVTGLRGILTALTAPGQQATETMNRFGLTAQGVQDTIRRRGLLTGLEDLTGRLHGNQEALHRIFPDVRAFNSAMILTGSNAKANEKIFADLANSEGSLNAAFAAVGQDGAFKFRAALAAVEAAGIRLGNSLLPIATKAADVVGRVASAFSHLPAGLQETAIVAGLAAYPLVKVVGALQTATRWWGTYQAKKVAQVGVDATVGAAEEGLAIKTAASGIAAEDAAAKWGAAAVATRGGALSVVGAMGGLAVAGAGVGLVVDQATSKLGYWRQKGVEAALGPVGVLGLAVTGLRQSYETLTGSHTKDTKATQAATVAARANTAASKAEAQAQQQVSDKVAAAIPLFDGYKAKSKLTASSILANLTQERNAYRTWATDVQTLLHRGADPTVIQALSEKGPGYLHAMVGASDKQLKSLATIFGQRSRAAGNVMREVLALAGAQAGAAAARAVERNFHPVLAVSAAAIAVNPRAGQIARNQRFAAGGVLSEHVVGVGMRSGARYDLAEAGPEAVTPLGARGGGGFGGFGGGGGGGNIYLIMNVHGVVGSPDDVARKLAHPMRRELLSIGKRVTTLWSGADGHIRS